MRLIDSIAALGALGIATPAHAGGGTSGSSESSSSESSGSESSSSDAITSDTGTTTDTTDSTSTDTTGTDSTGTTLATGDQDESRTFPPVLVESAAPEFVTAGPEDSSTPVVVDDSQPSPRAIDLRLHRSQTAREHLA